MPDNSSTQSSISGRPAVFLDRDGVINAMVYNPEFGLVDSPANPDEFELLPGVGGGRSPASTSWASWPWSCPINPASPREGSPQLSSRPRPARCTRPWPGLEARLDAVYYCLHHPQAVVPDYRLTCECRKPGPGCCSRPRRDLGIDLAASYLVGDGITDVAAGQAAGVKTLFVSSRKCYICGELARQSIRPDFVVRDLPEAVEVIRLAGAGDWRRSRAICRFQPSLHTGGALMEYVVQYLNEAAEVIRQIDPHAIERTVDLLAGLRRARGRLFFLGVGGSAANCSHAVNDFRKIAGIEAYAPTDNVSELTARVNDDGWETAYTDWLRVSRLGAADMIFVLSVGGGNAERNVSWQPGARPALCPAGWCHHLWRGGPRRRLYGAGGGCVRDRARVEPGNGHARIPNHSSHW